MLIKLQFGLQLVNKSRVVNDAAEKIIKLITEYNMTD